MFWKLVLASTAWLVLPAAAWILAHQVARHLGSPSSQNLKISQFFDRSRIVS